MRKFRGIPSGFRKSGGAGQALTPVAEEQPQPIQTKRLGTQRYRLVPVCGEGQEATLYDIFEGDEWCGSRRTVEQCATFLKTPLLLLD